MVLPVDGLMDKGRVKNFLQPYAKYERQRIELYSLWFMQRNEKKKCTFEVNFFPGRHQVTGSTKPKRQPQKSLRHYTVEKQYGV